MLVGLGVARLLKRTTPTCQRRKNHRERAWSCRARSTQVRGDGRRARGGARGARRRRARGGAGRGAARARGRRVRAARGRRVWGVAGAGRRLEAAAGGLRGARRGRRGGGLYRSVLGWSCLMILKSGSSSGGVYAGKRGTRAPTPGGLDLEGVHRRRLAEDRGGGAPGTPGKEPFRLHFDCVTIELIEPSPFRPLRVARRGIRLASIVIILAAAPSRKTPRKSSP